MREPDAVLAGLEEAGDNAPMFGTPTISDGMAMGTEGMTSAPVNRELASDRKAMGSEGG